MIDYSILPLVRFFKQFDIELIHVQEVGTKGGSLRYYRAIINSDWKPSLNVKELTLREVKEEINAAKFKDYGARIDSLKFKLLEFLEKNKKSKIVGYGASATSTTSTTLITHFELQKYFSYLVDDNIDKVNTYSPRHHIPVYDIDFLKKDMPNVIIILARRFKAEILKKLSFFSGVVILPLPIFEEIQL